MKKINWLGISKYQIYLYYFFGVCVFIGFVWSSPAATYAEGEACSNADQCVGYCPDGGCNLSDSRAWGWCSGSWIYDGQQVINNFIYDVSHCSSGCDMTSYKYNAFCNSGSCSACFSGGNVLCNQTAPTCYQSTPVGLAPFCGDGICNGNDTMNNCPGDCNPPINAACGDDNGGIFSSAPSSSLCYPGSASGVSESGSNWLWTCFGSNGGTDSPPCSANKPTPTFSIQPSSQTIAMGQTTSFSAIYDPDGPSGPQVQQNVTASATWGPADTADCGAVSNAVVTKVGNGQYKSVAPGNACVQASYSGLNSAAGVVVTPIPPPTNLTASCPAPGNVATLSWTAPAGYNNFYVRNDDVTNGMPADSHVYWNENFTGTTYTIPNNYAGFEAAVNPVPGHSYRAWIHTRIADGSFSSAPGVTYTCQAAVCPVGNVTVSPSTITVGQTSTASVPAGWSGGQYNSSNTSVVSRSGSTLTGVSGGTSQISGSGWNAPNSATNCNLSAANLTVNVPVTATADIKANNSDAPPTIPSNTSANLSWSYSNATSCTVSSQPNPTIYPNGNGSASTLNLLVGRTYTISCNPVGSNSSDSVTVDVEALASRNLYVTKAGQGTVTSSPSGISCGVGCPSQSAPFDSDSTVHLTAKSASGRIFTGWTGCDSSTRNPNGSGGTCDINMGSIDKSVNASFALNLGNFQEF